ncbi:DUF320-domain-containing protein [Conidiobolus coronatus NRRL 28638]|uniref:DUF320-domain-containing protein n=1 Tax=Conidiobolus coronatus (strain ATCC 28846 / CBS 209.66 / NRRL 28638) TaxID=796925 RepID=A0A137NT69_CONC2|nr:DUF320-domain-containing protein [Conidiobolus coronatus NRRL 28638]|eukprot:KXN65912.1 DUF320-domain-containing protein [Conidiobolus coronatus NRRL 28638]
MQLISLTFLATFVLSVPFAGAPHYPEGHHPGYPHYPEGNHPGYPHYPSRPPHVYPPGTEVGNDGGDRPTYPPTYPPPVVVDPPVKPPPGTGVGDDNGDRGTPITTIGASKSPGTLSGNVIQIPIVAPINACGNTVDVIGVLNPAFGNNCENSIH